MPKNQKITLILIFSLKISCFFIISKHLDEITLKVELPRVGRS
jgi:hypothetical protein